MNEHPTSNLHDLSQHWMPFTANRQFKDAPRLFTAAHGMHYTTDDGRRVLDATAGMWCVNAGHGREEIADAVHRQLLELDFAPPFQMGHPLSFDWATRLAGIAPEGMDRIFFTNSGSESVDTALKIAIAYHRARGEPGRVRLIGRERGYHGVNFGGMSVGGIGVNRRQFGQLLPAVDHLPHTQDLARNAFSRGLPEHGAEKADVLEALVALHGADTIAAVIVEPVAGSTGVLPPPKGYLERLRSLCTKHGILLIFDEVITGFGRTGTPFAATTFGIAADILTTAKGVTNGVVPAGAVFVQRAVHDALMQGPESAVELLHGYTYSGHPTACAAGLAVLDIYAREALLTRGAELAPSFEDAVHSLRELPNVIDIRNFGLMAAIELAPRAEGPGRRGYEVMVDCFRSGLLVRAAGDAIALSPPLIAEREHFEEMAAILGEAIKRAS